MFQLTITICALIISLFSGRCDPGNLTNTVQALFYNSSNASNPIDLQLQNVDPLTFDVTKQIKVICHGWLLNDTIPWYSPTIKAYLNQDYYVIALDWSNYSSIDFVATAANAELVASFYSETLINLHNTVNYSSNLLHLIGHSLGAHICGYIAVNINATVGIVARITGLDPAGPEFEFNAPYLSLNKSDANFVDAIHTNAAGGGTIQSIGDIDFWPNGGLLQIPPCLTNITDLGCSHNLAPVYFYISINNTNFVARKCSSYLTYTDGLCDSNAIGIMGEHVNQTLTGNFFLSTNAAFPYAKG